MMLWPNREIDGKWKHGKTELQLIHQLVDRRVDGLILRPIEDSASDDYLHEIHDHHLPLVAVDRALPNSHRADFVGTDDYSRWGNSPQNIYLAWGIGHIVHFAGPDFTMYRTTSSRRVESIIKSCPDVQYDVCQNKTFSGNPDFVRSYFATHRYTYRHFCCQ